MVGTKLLFLRIAYKPTKTTEFIEKTVAVYGLRAKRSFKSTKTLPGEFGKVLQKSPDADVDNRKFEFQTISLPRERERERLLVWKFEIIFG